MTVLLAVKVREDHLNSSLLKQAADYADGDFGLEQKLISEITRSGMFKPGPGLSATQLPGRLEGRSLAIT